MKFKILEVNDYDYDIKDKNMITYDKWLKLRRIIRDNPKRMTFNPLEVELQKCYEVWMAERNRKCFLFLYVVFCILAITLVIYCGGNYEV